MTRFAYILIVIQVKTFLLLPQIITIEMNRRWSCRLGIRLESQLSRNIEGKSITVIKEICKDTLAEKDGRLVAGDRVLMVRNFIDFSFNN